MLNNTSFPSLITDEIPVFLAPLSGITDLPFRMLNHAFGARYVVSEMVASSELMKNRKEYLRRVEFMQNGLNIIQIAGREPLYLAQAAELISDKGADMIDINMGCPSKHVTGGASGCALMRDPCLAAKIMQAVVKASSCPVSLKMRLGWDEETINAPLLARIAEETGIKMLTIHARTRAQFYKGFADWEKVKPVVEATNLPVLINGDIVDENSAKMAMEQSGARGVMIGRGACGKPWQVRSVLSSLNNKMIDQPKVRLLKTITMHYQDMIEFYGEALGVRNARKHLSWYLEELFPCDDPQMHSFRAKLLQENDPKEVLNLIQEIFVEKEYSSKTKAE